MPSENFIKNITSKDLNLSENTIQNLIKSRDLEKFSYLCNKSDFIFDFLKQRIVNSFVKLINKEDLRSIFEFSKIYCPDFEDMIVKSWVKFASEDLTDEILELFEQGTNEQKAYCAKYFSSIQDTLALEGLQKYSKSDFSPLRINCAQSLAAFKDEKVLNEMKEIILNSSDDFEKLNAFEFISAYRGDENIKFISKNAFLSPFVVNIISNLLDFNDLNSLKNILNDEEITKIFNVLLEGYPEDISLDTIQYYQILDFINLIKNYNTPYSNNTLLLAKTKFGEFSQNDIYSFDLDKNLKIELKNITNFLNSLDLKFCFEYDSVDYHYNLMLDIIRECRIFDFNNSLANIINEKELSDKLKAKTAQTLYELNQANLIDKKILNEIENENIKALIASYLDD